MRTLRFALALLLVLGSASATADILLRVPVVTQVQGAVFYRTSMTIGNASSQTANIILRLTYRSPADGTMQTTAALNAGALPTSRTLYYEDMIETFKDQGLIRAADAGRALFGTLLVTFDANGLRVDECLAEARTYSPATGGGTNGIAYVGRDSLKAGSGTIKAAVRNGSFGGDGTTRANIGFVNEGTSGTDIDVTFRDGSTGLVLRSFTVENVAADEVVQLNNIFSNPAIPAGTRTMMVRAQATVGGGRISGYAVQLDSVTNDGSFFLFAEDE